MTDAGGGITWGAATRWARGPADEIAGRKFVDVADHAAHLRGGGSW